MAPHNTTQPIIQGSAVVGNEILLPTYKEQYKYWTFLFVKRKRLNYNRYLTRGGIDYPYTKLLNDGRLHRHKFRIKRMKSCNRTFYYEDRRFDNSVIFKKKSYLQMIKPR